MKIDLVAAARRAHQAGDAVEAEKLYEKILSLQPGQLDALNGLAALCAGQNRAARAADLWRKAIQVAPQIPEFKSNLAKLLQSAGQESEALKLWQDYVAMRPQDGPAWQALGRLASRFGKYNLASQAYAEYATRHPADMQGLIDLLYARLDEENLPEVRRILMMVKMMSPDHPVVLNAEAMLARAEDNLDEAIKKLRLVIGRKPDFAAAWNNLGVALQDKGDYDAAIVAYDQALALSPGHRSFAYNRTNCHLVFGKLAEGWAGLRDWIDLRSERTLPQPFWQGEDLRGKKVLLWNYQGVGEDILQASLFDELLAMGATLVIETQPRLIELYRQRWPEHNCAVEYVVRPGKQHAENPRVRNADIHYQIPGFWACRYLRPEFESFPATRTPFLCAGQNLAARMRADYLGKNPTAKKIIGISWRAAGLFRRRRSLDLADWLPLLQQPDTVFVDVQYGDTSAERADFAARFPHIPLIHDDRVDAMTSLASQAAQLMACDEIVSVRNSTVHLAGALGKPCHVLMPPSQATTWFWFRDMAHSPWYPTLRLYPLGDGDFDWPGLIKNLSYAA